MRKESSRDSSVPAAACQAPARPPAVILVRPREEGNVGAAARAMANMGLRELVLVEPAPRLGGVARGFGVGGWHVLDAARRAPDLDRAIAPFRRVVGTSAARERPLAGARVVTARQLAGVLAEDPPATPTALVFGPEDKGLRREEIERCSVVVRIPASPEHPTLNLAQAVLVVAYELRVAEPTESRSRAEPRMPATAEEVEGLLAAGSRALERLGFDQPHILRALVRDARRLTLRAGATSHEVRVVWRVVNRLLRRLKPE